MKFIVMAPPKANPVEHKRNRVVLTLKQEIEIRNKMERSASRNVWMKEYNIWLITLYNIQKQKDKLLKFLVNSWLTVQYCSLVFYILM